jgi:hypothetical protein
MENITQHIIKLIKSDTYLNNIFYSFNSNITLPHYIIIHKLSNKLFNYNVINLMYEDLVNKYIKKYKCNKFLINSTFISNKISINIVSYNKCYSKHTEKKYYKIFYNNFFQRIYVFLVIKYYIVKK